MNKHKQAHLIGLGLVMLISILVLAAPRAGQARSGVRGVNIAPFADGYEQHNLVSDLAGRADQTDPNLINPWGLAISPTGPWWISNNGTETSTLYHGDGS